MNFTHEDLRKRAVQWLTNTQHCGVVLSEMRALCIEIPDAMHSESASRRMTAMHQTHGMSRTPEYRAWIEMWRRVTRPKHKERYADRGITVCWEWRSFEQFYKDVGDRPSPQHSLDRENNDGNYEPGNCHWATIEQQNRNKSSVHRITIGDVTQTSGEWAKASGLSASLILLRFKAGWEPSRLLSKPRGYQEGGHVSIL